MDGNGKTITGLAINSLAATESFDKKSANDVAGLFGLTVGASISNLNIDSALVDITKLSDGDISAGILVGTAYKSDFKDITISGSVTVNSQNRAAGGLFAGAVSQGDASNISVSGDVQGVVENAKKSLLLGLFVGNAEGASFTRLTTDGVMKLKPQSTFFGGLVAGYAINVNVNESNIAGKITASNQAVKSNTMIGGIFGTAENCEDSLCQLNPVFNVIGRGYVYLGGAYGYASNTKSNSLTCTLKLKGQCKASEYCLIAGGVVGYSEASKVENGKLNATFDTTTITSSCIGSVLGKATETNVLSTAVDTKLVAASTDDKASVVFAGGIAGDITSCNISDTTVKGSLSLASKYDGYAGGIAGIIKDGSYSKVNCEVSIDNASASGSVSGGFAGHGNGTEVFTDCVPAAKRNNTGKNIYDEESIATTETN